MNITLFSAPTPYPSLQDLKENFHDLQLIRNNYAGICSEFSATAQYVYHQLQANHENFPSIGHDLLSIAQVEMRHLNLFGSALLKLGGQPLFSFQNPDHCSYWSGSMIDCSKKIKTMLQKDLQLEKSTIALYNCQQKRVCQPTLAHLLKRIIEDEQIHQTILEELLSQLDE